MKILLFVLFVIAAPFFAQAGNAPTWKEKCPSIKACIDSYSELTGEQYIYDKDVSGTINITENFPFVKEDADLIFTNILSQNYLSRVQVKQGVYNILRTNDAKSRALPVITCDQNTAPKLPNTYDLVTLEYRFTNGAMAKDAENVIRTYMDMGARIYGVELPGLIYITDTAKQMPKAYGMLKDLDVKPTKEYLENRKKWNEARMKEMANGGPNRNKEKEPHPAPPAPPKKDKE